MNEFHFGALPDGWRKLPMRRCLLMRQNGSWGDEPVSDGDGEYCLRAADFDYPRLAFKGEGNFVRRSYGPGAFESVRLKDGDILIEKSGGGEKTPVGRAILFDDSFTAGFSNFMERQRVNAQICVPEYYFYWWTAMYQQDVFTQYIKQTTGLQNLDTGTLLSQEYMPLPPLSEQVQIARAVKSNLLDIQNATDQLCAQISTLERCKSSLIHEAVTKGLDRDVPTRPSGIEWIGSIPKSWQVQQLRFAIKSMLDVDHFMPESVDDGLPYLMIGDLAGRASEIDFNRCKQISRDDFEYLSSKSRPIRGDLIVARYATIGTCCLVDVDAKFVVSYGCLTITPNPNYLCSNFLCYYFKSDCFLNELRLKTNSNTQGNVGKEALRKARVILPPIQEQREIARYLDDRCSRIDRILDLKRQQVDVLRRRRQSLIYEYVTGKRRVNQEA